MCHNDSQKGTRTPLGLVFLTLVMKATVLLIEEIFTASKQFDNFPTPKHIILAKRKPFIWCITSLSDGHYLPKTIKGPRIEFPFSQKTASKRAAFKPSFKSWPLLFIVLFFLNFSSINFFMYHLCFFKTKILEDLVNAQQQRCWVMRSWARNSCMTCSSKFLESKSSNTSCFTMPCR